MCCMSFQILILICGAKGKAGKKLGDIYYHFGGSGSCCAGVTGAVKFYNKLVLYYSVILFVCSKSTTLEYCNGTNREAL